MQSNDSKQVCWHYRKCMHLSPLSATLCENPSCRAELSIYGEIVELNPEEKTETPKQTVSEPEPPVVPEKKTRFC